MRCSRSAASVLMTIALAMLHPIEAEEIFIYRDSRAEPILFYPYTLRILVVKGDGPCFARGSRGELLLVCQPIANATVKAVYLETGEVLYADTDNEGIAELRFRIMTPKVTFKVEALGSQALFEASANILGLITVTAFASMVAALVVFLRRGFW